MRASQVIPVASLLLSAAACGGSTPTGTSNTPPDPGGTPAQAATIQLQDNYYSPSTVLIAAGGTVTWDWVGSGHSVTSDGSPSFTPNAPVSFAPHTLGPVVFASAGTYSFHCSVHGVPGVYGSGQMTGAVFVR